MEPDHPIIVGHRHEWGGNLPCEIDVAARRQHVYAIGQTGAGKSTLLRNMILQDIECGRGVALVDPHGDLALDILDEIPPWRTGDVVYFDPAADDPLAINLFRGVGHWHSASSGIVSAFKKIWGDSWGPRLEYLLFASVAALAQCDNTSLLGVSRMLYDERYRAWVVKQVRDPMIRNFWTNEFERYSRAFQQEAVSPIQNKVGQIFLSPFLRNVLGQIGTKISFRFMMDQKRIFIANLSKGKLGETHSSLMGSLLVTGFEQAALSRADILPSERQNFYFYADEFQLYATDSFSTILSESRKYGLCLTLAHQYMGQLNEKVANAVFGNVGTLVAFRVGETDASALERQFGGAFTAGQFTNLENFEMHVRLLNKQPFLATSLPPTSSGRCRRKLVERHSRQKYCSRRIVAEEKIERWLKKRY